jgi:hypothetical protein
VNRNPTQSQIHVFGLVVLGGMVVIGVLLWYRGLLAAGCWWPDAGWGWKGNSSQVVAIVLWALGVCIAVACLLSYVLGRLLYIVWMTGAMYLGMVMTTLMLSVLFFVLLPVFSLIRLKDPLRLKLKRSDSYWEEPTPHEATIDRMRRPF